MAGGVYETEAQVRAGLRDDTPYYARNVVQIVDRGGRTVPLEANAAQLKLQAAIDEQRAAGLPVRVIVLKSRKVGISTWVQVGLLQRVTQLPNRRAQVVAHDNKTANALFAISHFAYNKLPDDAEVKPYATSIRQAKNGSAGIDFMGKGRNARVAGDMGLNSSLSIDTAKEADAGRGLTISDLHLSEVAFWENPEKATSILNAMSDEPDTFVVIESTGKGHNFFKARWDRAMRGEGSYIPVFIGWTEDPACRRPFASPEERAAFVETIGSGPWGKEEPRLVEKFAATAEQLHWRRKTIVDKCDGKLETFKQEYPSSPEEAFIASGQHVFSIEFIQRALDRAEAVEARAPEHGGPQTGLLLPAGVRRRQLAYSEVEVPTGAIWTPRSATGFGDAHPWWTLFEHPVTAATDAEKPEEERRQPGQYIVAIDPAGDEEATTTGERAYHAIQVIDHRTREQVARWRARMDPDLVALQAFLAGLYFNEAWIAVEVTGGWGIPIVKKLWKELGYRRVYQRKTVESKKEKQQDRLGWSTDRKTKPLMEAGMHQALREGTHGIRDRLTALELTTYVKDDKGHHGPDADAFSDLLMAYMIAQAIADETPVRPMHKSGVVHNSMTRHIGGAG